jgi:hypothetical protein
VNQETAWGQGAARPELESGSVRPEVGDDRWPPPVGDRGREARDVDRRWATAGPTRLGEKRRAQPDRKKKGRQRTFPSWAAHEAGPEVRK